MGSISCFCLPNKRNHGDQWIGKPWKSLKNQGINSVVSKTQEKSGNFISICWESGNNYMESCLECTTHVLLMMYYGES